MGYTGMCKRRREEEVPKVEEHIIKFAAARASPGVVSLVSHHVPEEMLVNLDGFLKMKTPKEYFFYACGLILECSSAANSNANANANAKYICTVVAPASLFKRPLNVPLDDIEIDVFVSTDFISKAHLLACDFHYNLAALTFESHSPFPTAPLKSIDDCFSIDPTLVQPHPPSRLRPHSDLFKLLPASPILSVWRSHRHPHGLLSASATFCSRSPTRLSCDELYELKHLSNIGRDGAPALNSFGDIIGMIFSSNSFLPSNTVSRWWNHYKASGEFCRPFLGMEVANLHDADLDILAQIMTKFPGITTAVVVTKVNDDSPASRSGIHTNDVIVKIDGKLVRSKVKFYERTWGKIGKSVDFTVVRVTSGEGLSLSLVIGDTSPNKYNRWELPNWRMVTHPRIVAQSF